MAIIGMDIHRSFAQAAFLQDGQVKREQRVDLIHDRLIKFGKSLSVEDEVVIEATGNSAAVERILKGYLASYGRPLAFYSDKHSIFRVSKPDAEGGQGMTQFGRALSDLGIEILCANSSQAKGRVERVNRTLQDRLVKELRLDSISTLEAANAYLSGFVARFNDRFATAPARPENHHRPLARTLADLDAILAWRE